MSNSLLARRLPPRDGEYRHMCDKGHYHIYGKLGTSMLTAEDLEDHERLLGAAPRMALADLLEAYRQARRLYETRHWAGEDAAEPEARSRLLASALADRLAFGSEADFSANHEGSGA